MTRKLRLNYTILLLTISVAIVSGLAVSGLLTTSVTLSSTGSVKAINAEVYWDLECTLAVSSIDWGTPEPGDSDIKTVYIRNSGTAPMTLSMSCSDWNPVEAGNHLTLSWDREGAILDAGAVVPALLTFTVLDTVSGITDFSFNIVIEGTG